MLVVEDSFQKIDFLEFNDNDVLIQDNHFSHLSRFCNLLDEFVGLKCLCQPLVTFQFRV